MSCCTSGLNITGLEDASNHLRLRPLLAAQRRAVTDPKRTASSSVSLFPDVRESRIGTESGHDVAHYRIGSIELVAAS